MTLDSAPDVLTVTEAAKLLRIGRNQAYEAVRTGTLRAIHLGRSIRIPKAAVRDLIESPAHPQAA
jgi:excisionase family DNA binding protein